MQCLINNMYVRDFEQPLMVYDEYVTHRHILLIVPPILLTIGSFGNLFSFIILFKSRGKASTYIYLCALAMVDLLVLYIGLLRLWIAQFMTNIVDMNNIICKVGIFLGYVSSDTSVWLIVAVTIERFIAVMFPLKAQRFCNARTARIAIITIIVLFMIVNGHFLWSVELHHYPIDNTTIISKCHAKAVFSHLSEEVWPWVDAAIYSFVPFIIIMLLNSFIIRNIISAKRKRNVLRQKSSLLERKGMIKSNRKQGETNKKITLMLLAVSFTFLITTLPVNLVLIYTSSSQDFDVDDDLMFVKRRLIETAATMLMYVNHSINFFLYCLTGKKFRDQFKALVCSCCSSPSQYGLGSTLQKYSTASFRFSSKDSRMAYINSEDTNGNVFEKCSHL